MNSKAVFLDRDGTVIKEKPGVYLHAPGEVKLYKNTKKAFKLFKKLGYKIFIVSNQSGIGRGYFTEKEVNGVNCKMAKLLASCAKIEEIVYCPHAPNEPCQCRKPLPLLGQKLIKKYKIDASKSFTVGDKKSDVDFGLNLKTRSILTLTGNGRREAMKYKNINAKITSDLYGAAKYVSREG
jgi:D-glycero-D-manno-heptose 1,7-bisphosphate phosphatase